MEFKPHPLCICVNLRNVINCTVKQFGQKLTLENILASALKPTYLGFGMDLQADSSSIPLVILLFSDLITMVVLYHGALLSDPTHDSYSCFIYICI